MDHLEKYRGMVGDRLEGPFANEWKGGVRRPRDTPFHVVFILRYQPVPVVHEATEIEWSKKTWLENINTKSSIIPQPKNGTQKWCSHQP
jgi:hypothetical protein